jgi:F-type H+-transporting ATPase subunit c
MVRPFSLALRLFVAMIAGHILMEVFGSFIVSGSTPGGGSGPAIRSSASSSSSASRARAAGLRDPGLCLRTADVALHQRRGQPSLAFTDFPRSFIMDLASAQVIGAGLAAIGVGAAAIGVGNVFGSFLESALRNPAAADGQQGRLFIGFAAAELLGLIAFAVAMIILYAR